MVVSNNAIKLMLDLDSAWEQMRNETVKQYLQLHTDKMSPAELKQSMQVHI